ncbi:S-adenosyl-L-methionine-dependent methyltransferase [Aspergillus stella-maris]|uniref:S-adenosyl-L-methionine-dependent methyltransferase n=1 Tax=Aspergillus stella-maris TaxID=1810926 RepID=UPI003CCDC96B
MKSSTQATDTESIIASISRLAEELGTGSTLTKDQEKHLRTVCQKVLSGLGKSSLQVEFPEKTAIKIALDMGVFDFVCGSDKDEFTVDEIAKHANADPVLVERIMRALSLSCLFSPTWRDTYKANRSVQDLAPGAHMRDMVNFTHDVADSTLLKLPEFLAKNKYRNPNRADATAFQHAHQTNEPFYSWLQRHPPTYSSFCGMMKSTEDFAARWPDLFPVTERFLQYRQPHAQRALTVVDIAGGTGHNMQRLVDRVPDLKGDLVLQDYAEPVIGADVYALTRVLHNWPDEECLRILGHIVAAMGRNSILLIGDKVFPTGAAEISPTDVMADMSMMMLLGGMERTEAQFRQLLSSVGLEVVNIWRSTGPIKNHEGLLEVRLADGPSQ